MVNDADLRFRFLALRCFPNTCLSPLPPHPLEGRDGAQPLPSGTSPSQPWPDAEGARGSSIFNGIGFCKCFFLETGVERDAPQCSPPRAFPPDLPHFHPFLTEHRPCRCSLESRLIFFFFFWGGGLVWKLGWKIISNPQIRNRIIIKRLVLEGTVCVIPQQ